MKSALFLAAACFSLHALAQQPSFKFGKVSPEDLQKKVYAVDSNAAAVVLFDVGRTELNGNNNGGLSYEFKHHRKVHIIGKAGYDLANVDVMLYVDGTTEEQVRELKAVTYNLEGGNVVQTKIDKSAIFKEKLDKNHIRTKFTLPNIKEGSIIEYEYTVISPYFVHLQPWSFQSSVPHLWSEFEFSLPQFMDYVFLSQGYQPFFKKEAKDRSGNFSLRDDDVNFRSQSTNFSCNVTDHKWVMKDVPGLREERFTSTLRNHIAKIEFQFAGFKDPFTPKRYMENWVEAVKKLREDENFGRAIHGNAWLSDDLKAITANATTPEEKAKKIFAYVRDNFVCNNHNAISTTTNLKTVFKNRKGNVSEINLLLTAMLGAANITADPVLLSTKDHGYPPDFYPLMNRFNYVVCQAYIGDKNYLLDASQARNGFGRLPADCYNGSARVINEAAALLPLEPDSLRERKVTFVVVSNDAKGKWIGGMKQLPGYYESAHIRDEINEKGKETFFKEIQKNFGTDVTIEQPGIDSLQRYEDPVNIHYNFVVNKEDADVLYVNPLFGEAYKQSPFKSADRFYPVEMPYTTDETYVLTMDVPEGYAVDELPKPIKLKLNDAGDGYFEYLLTQSGNTISLRSRVTFNRSFFSPDEYPILREFFNMIVNKQGEQIVFKKKK